MNIAEWLYATARLRPRSPALMTGLDIEADYAEFARRCAGIAGALRDRFGIASGDRVAIYMKNRTEYLEAMYGIYWAGAVAVPINAKLLPKEALTIIDDAQARLVVVSDDIGQTLRLSVESVLSVDGEDWWALRNAKPVSQPVYRDDHDLAWLFYTSGTTGKPKGVMLSHGNLVAMSLCYPIDVDPPTAADAALYAAPISHGAGMYSFIHVRVGARHVVTPSGGFDADEILTLSRTLRNVSFFAAPTMVRRLVEAATARDADGDGIRTIVYGGGPMYLADIEIAVRRMGPRFVQVYGQGESPMTITALSRELIANRGGGRWRERLASVGVPQSCVEMRIGDAQGNPVPTGEVGEVMARGPQVMGGYWRNEKATSETLRDGWLMTGDLGRVDEDGFLTLTDRSKDLIISGGSNIYPREVEEALLMHEAVKEVSVVGRANPEWGEEVVAFVSLEAGKQVTAEELDAFCVQEIARFKRPRAYYFIADLPKNNYGKIVKGELRKMLADTD